MKPEYYRVVLVTGGSRGIGAEICRYMIKAGYHVVIGYCKNEEKAIAVASEHERAMIIRLDLHDRFSVQEAFAAIESRFGPVDILVNNAAVAQEKPFLEITDDDWNYMLSVNLIGAVRCIREALPSMIRQEFGRIINISSIGGQWGGMNQVHYAASKAALINLTRSMAKLYSKNGITCNAIAPGLIATDMSATELETPTGQEKVKAIPAGRLGFSEEIGAAVAYLASKEAAYITGQTLNFNGGMHFV